MIRLIITLFLAGVCVSFNGCSEATRSSEPIWQQVKISELKPSSSPAGSTMQIEIGVYIYEVPAENLDTLTDVSEILHIEPLRFAQPEAFKANDFSVGFAREQMWGRLGDLLRKAGAKLNKKTSLIFFEEQTNEVSIAELQDEQTIFYIAADGQIEGVTLQPGRIGLQIAAKKITGARGICEINVKPIYQSAGHKRILRLSSNAKIDGFVFEAVAFGVKVSPGDFVFIHPEKNQLQHATLSGLFFSQEARPGTVRTYLIVCRRVRD